MEATGLVREPAPPVAAAQARRRCGRTAGRASRFGSRSARAQVGVLLVAAALVGCGDRTAIQEGGRVPGDVVTVYTLAPATPAGDAAVRAAKEALFVAGGEAGEVIVQFASRRLPEGRDAVADLVESVVRDTQTIAVIDAGPPQVTAPLLNAVGILHVSLAAPADVEQPAERRTYFPVTAEAMESVLTALRQAKDRATVRAAVIDAYGSSP